MIDVSYFLYGGDEESLFHLAVKYPFTRGIWFASRWGVRLDDINVSSVQDFLL